MAEHIVSRHVMTAIKQFGGHASRIENMVGVGMPDITYCIHRHEGFIENKWRDRWPASPYDVVTLPHFTPQQRLWIRDRSLAGGTVWVMLHVQRPTNVWLLLPGMFAQNHLGIDATRADIHLHAVLAARGPFPSRRLIQTLRVRESLT